MQTSGLLRVSCSCTAARHHHMWLAMMGPAGPVVPRCGPHAPASAVQGVWRTRQHALCAEGLQALHAAVSCLGRLSCLSCMMCCRCVQSQLQGPAPTRHVAVSCPAAARPFQGPCIVAVCPRHPLMLSTRDSIAGPVLPGAGMTSPPNAHRASSHPVALLHCMNGPAFATASTPMLQQR